MKKFALFFLLILLKLPAVYGEEKTLVCFPSVDPLYRELEFQIKPSQNGHCGKEERIYEVKKSEGGIILFMPYENSIPSSQPSVSGTSPFPKTGKSVFSNF